MSNSNVIDLRAWRDKPLGELSGRHIASTQETLLLLKTFMAVESPLIRGEIISVAQDAALLGDINRPPCDEPYHQTPNQIQPLGFSNPANSQWNLQGCSGEVTRNRFAVCPFWDPSVPGFQHHWS
jgi:hypothetical protein